MGLQDFLSLSMNWKTINLGRNAFTSTNLNLGLLPVPGTLKELYLKDNNIGGVITLDGSRGLEKLDMRFNPFTNIVIGPTSSYLSLTTCLLQSTLTCVPSVEMTSNCLVC